MADVDRIVTEIRKATKGFGTDEKALINTLINLTPIQAAEVNTYYKANYGKSVVDVIESECSGDFGKVLSKICLPEPYTAAQNLHKAMNNKIVSKKYSTNILIRTQ